MTTNDRDAMIRLAIVPAADVHAPADLGDAIYGEILATPQRRGGIRLGRLAWLPAPAPFLVTLALVALLAVALVIVALSRSTGPPILAMYHGGPDRTGVMPGPGPQGDGVIEWDVARPGALLFNTMPLPVGGRVIVGDRSGVLAALDVATGVTLWELDVGSPISGAPALVRDPSTQRDLVVVGTESGDVVAVHVEDRTQVWREAPDGSAVHASFLVAEGVLYAGTEAGTIFALDPASGRTLWSVPVGGSVTRGPAFADGVLFVGTSEGRMSAIDVATHLPRWVKELGDGEVGTPTVGGGRVFAGRGLLAADVTHDLVALDVRDGSIDWTFVSPAGEQVHMGGLANGRVYAVSEDHNVYALDEATGELRWTALTAGRVTSLAAIVDDVVYVPSEDRFVRALDAGTGRELWRVPVTGAPTMAAVVDGRVLVGTDLGRVVAIGGQPGQ